MSRQAGAATALFALAAGSMLLALVLWASLVNDPFTPDIALFPIAYLAFAAVGALILSRRPANVIGRLAMAAGVGGSVLGVMDSIARAEGEVPGQAWAAWAGAVGFPLTLAPILFLVLLFPNGRLPSPRWRVVAALVLIGSALVALGNALTPGFSDYRHPNPIGIAGFEEGPLAQGGVGWLLVIAGAIVTTGGLVPRLLRARDVERQQLKWITFAAAIHALSWVVLALDLAAPWGELAGYILFATLTLIPVAAGIAVLRYRLYDIDVVIRRTLVYAAVIAILAVAYVALVLGTQSLLAGVTQNRTLPVAVSTLAIAALFGPVRRRVRDLVDRRFYRSRYDAQRTLEAFAGRLRDEVELDAVGATLVDVAGRAVRPAHAAVWVRDRPA